jgi:hypothetical protein
MFNLYLYKFQRAANVEITDGLYCGLVGDGSPHMREFSICVVYDNIVAFRGNGAIRRYIGAYT